MDNKTQARFQDITTDFLISNKKAINGLQIDITSVEITSQNQIRGIKDGVRNNRFLQDDEDTGLAVDLTISGTVQGQHGLPDNFSFADTVLNGFHNNFTVYNSLLEHDSTIYGSIMGTSTGDKTDNTTNENDRLALYIFIGCSVAGGLLVVFLAFLFVKMRRDRNRFELPANLTFQDENDFIQSQGIPPRRSSPQMSPLRSPDYGSRIISGSEYNDHNHCSNRSMLTFNTGPGTHGASHNSVGVCDESFGTFSNRTVSRSEWQGSFADPPNPTPYSEDDRNRRNNMHSPYNANSQSVSTFLLSFKYELCISSQPKAFINIINHFSVNRVLVIC